MNLGLEFVTIGNIMQTHAISVEVNNKEGYTSMTLVIPNIRLKADGTLM